MITTNSTGSLSAKTTALVPAQMPKTPRLWYLPHVWNQIEYIIQASPKEVGWWGLVEKVDDDYLVTQLYVPPQTVSGTETDITADAMANLAVEIISADNDPSKLYYWGHSHVNMGVSPSGQDETQVRDYLKHCPVFIRGIYNKKGASKVDIYDVEQNVCFEAVDNAPAHPQLSDGARKELDTLLAANVKTAVAPPYVAPPYLRPGYTRQTSWRDDVYEPVDKNEKPKPPAVIPEADFFLIGKSADIYYNDLEIDDLADLHAHIYN